MSKTNPQPVSLQRRIGLPGLVLYGVGTIVGAGFYALLGKIIGRAGIFAPLSLLLAGGLALISAYSFAELSRRYPVSAGEVAYVQAAFGLPRLSQLVGVMVIATGLISAATLCAATGGFLFDLTGFPAHWLIVFTVLALLVIAAWGVAQSVAVVALITLLEVGTLVLIIVLSSQQVLESPSQLLAMFEQRADINPAALLAASFLAFYAFIGFEDMVNMAEEVRDVQHILPLAIVICLFVSLLLYLGVSVVALSLENRSALASANTPMALLFPQMKYSGIYIGVISVLAGLNGALVQMVMAARVMYGMARRGMAPQRFSRVNASTHTPLQATLLSGAIVLALSTTLSLSRLAETTSFIILLVFALVNASLATLRWREARQSGGLDIPWLPAIAAISCLSMLVLRLAQAAMSGS